ncbi:phosphomethylpyrimidine kinase, partial [Staphylococcus aureus]|uniref:bifunctional hydroxymethylpyrimidine kinase/phosphomethylpyrimidine kinase n=1 Tax=Staphylococcus aureus TaxID=1280 RepID=UPI00065C0982
TDIVKDYLFPNEGDQTFENERFNTKHTHGTGCTFSAVITAELAKGRPLFEAVHKAKKLISMSIQYTPEIVRGRGTVIPFESL